MQQDDRSAELISAMREARHKNDPTQIVEDFEATFGRLTATERTWLKLRILNSQAYARRS